MVKLAMCMLAANAPQSVKFIREAKGKGRLTDPETISNILTQKVLTMQDRATCESDPSYLQFIPYVMVFDSDGKVFNYSRGQGSGEERLKAKLSVGLGGHVDSLPEEDYTLADHLREEAAREIFEEVGFAVNGDQLNVCGILVDATESVGEVHIGILYHYTATVADVVNAEKDVIEKGEFVDASTLRQPETFDRLEVWSQLAIGS